MRDQIHIQQIFILKLLAWGIFFGATYAVAETRSKYPNLSDRAFLASAVFGPDYRLQTVRVEGGPKGEREYGLWLQKLAVHGNAAAQNNLGVKYATGDGVSKNYTAALRWLKIASNNGNATAEFNLGFMHNSDSGMLSSDEDSVSWFQRSANHGHALAQSLAANLLMSGGFGIEKDETAALVMMRKAADTGLPAAEFMLGQYYRNGQGVVADKAEGVKWIRKAADRGLPMAEITISELYEKGDGVTQNHAAALTWLEKAAANGSPLGQWALAENYASGTLGIKDDKKAFDYYLLAAKQGMSVACAAIGRAYAFGRGVEKNEIEAIQWFRKNADPKSHFLWVARKLYTGDGVDQNGQEAVKWYKAAADEGHDPQYLEMIAEIYTEGICVPKDLGEALKWYKMAAIWGSHRAQYQVGKMYAQGDGSPKDEVEALAWYYVSSTDDTKNYYSTDEMERRLGRAMTLSAQQRSNEIFSEIKLYNSADGTADQKKTSPKGTGTGTIISRHGHILTAAHVVAGARTIEITTASGFQIAKVIRIDEANDLAVLKIEGEFPHPLPVALSSAIRLGQAVATIGFPNIQIQGFSPKLTRGEISSLNGIGDDPRSWQISAPVQPGNSGGPLLDEKGNLIGVVVSKLGVKATQMTGDIPQNVNYAVKSAYALPLLEPYLGQRETQSSGAPNPKFEDMVAKAQQSVVLILVH